MDWLIGELVMLAVHCGSRLLLSAGTDGRSLSGALARAFARAASFHGAPGRSCGVRACPRLGPLARAADPGVTHSVCLPFGLGHSKGERCLDAAFLG